MIVHQHKRQLDSLFPLFHVFREEVPSGSGGGFAGDVFQLLPPPTDSHTRVIVSTPGPILIRSHYTCKSQSQSRDGIDRSIDRTFREKKIVGFTFTRALYLAPFSRPFFGRESRRKKKTEPRTSGETGCAERRRRDGIGRR